MASARFFAHSLTYSVISDFELCCLFLHNLR